MVLGRVCLDCFLEWVFFCFYFCCYFEGFYVCFFKFVFELFGENYDVVFVEVNVEGFFGVYVFV